MVTMIDHNAIFDEMTRYIVYRDDLLKVVLFEKKTQLYSYANAISISFNELIMHRIA